MIGTGYVGLVSGVCFSDLGNSVVCIDNNKTKIENLKKGVIPIYEPGLQELVTKNYKANRLNFTTDLKDAIKNSAVIFICVGTPTKKNSYSADLSQIYKVTREIRKYINNFKVIACSDINHDAALNSAKEFNVIAQSVDELLNNDSIELIINLTIPSAHKEIIKKTLQEYKA